MTRNKQHTTLAVSSKQIKLRKSLKITCSLHQKTLEHRGTHARPKKILRELHALQDLEALDFTKDKDSRTKFLANNDWKDSTLAPDEI